MNKKAEVNVTKKMNNRELYCPVCKEKTRWDDNPFRPFCSERCRLMDLGTWAAEGYRIAGETKDLSDHDNGEK